MGRAQVQVSINAADPTYDTSMTQEELTTGFANNPDSTLTTEGGWHLAGLTLSNIQNAFAAGYEQALWPDGSGCIQMTELSIDLVYTPVIYIAADHMHNQCRYTVTLAHEQRHVGTDLQVFNDYAPRMQAALTAFVNRLGPQGPFPPGQIQAAQDALLAQVEAAAEPMMEQLIETRRERQAVFDTQSNYLREGALCQGE
ncbi:MAG TPA: hypothetical protein VEF76_11800 [Patescibacteria group bacterium]|nr:hypothetical protein [Patescibacteria group bacterium]